MNTRVTRIRTLRPRLSRACLLAAVALALAVAGAPRLLPAAIAVPAPSPHRLPATCSATNVAPGGAEWISDCFPTVQADVVWGLREPGFYLDQGSLSGDYATGFSFWKGGLYGDANQARSLGEVVTIDSTVTSDDSSCSFHGTYHASPPGDFENVMNSGGGLVGMWADKPTDAEMTREFGASARRGTCGGTITWVPGTVPFGTSCEDDADRSGGSGRVTSSGTLETGRTDTWDFSCVVTDSAHQDRGSFGGAMTMQENPCPRQRHDRHWDDLKDSTQAHLTRYYDALESAGGCYLFAYGYTSREEQATQYDDWHQIADRRGPDDHRTLDEVNSDLRGNGLHDEVTGWRSDGTALGGPRKRTRHAIGEGADVVVGFRPMGVYPFQKSRVLAAAFNAHVRKFAKRADLCGPAPGNPWHVEMKYRARGERHARCHFG